MKRIESVPGDCDAYATIVMVELARVAAWRLRGLEKCDLRIPLTEVVQRP